MKTWVLVLAVFGGYSSSDEMGRRLFSDGKVNGSAIATVPGYATLDECLQAHAAAVRESLGVMRAFCIAGPEQRRDRTP